MNSQVVAGLLPTERGLEPVRVEFKSRIESITSISSRSDLPLLTAGLVDTHSHGLLGHAVTDNPDELLEISRSAVKFGVTRTVLSLVSSSSEATVSVLNAASSVLGQEGFSGIHLEGPFLASERCGAHQLENLRDCTDSELEQIVNSKALTSITIAPERVSLDQAKELAKKARLALGHTDCDYTLAKLYFEGSTTVLTHALNAMRQLTSRDPGPLGAALDANALIEVIADGHHLHPTVVKALFDMSDKPVLVTDSISAAGLGDTELMLGEVSVEVRSGIAKRLDNGALAGSTLTLNQAVANCVKWGVPLFDAVAAATSTPAEHYGIGSQLVAPGEVADLVLWSEFNPLAVFRSGELVHGSLVS